MNITIHKDLINTLEKISSREGLTPEKYASNIVQSFLERQYRAAYIDKIKKTNFVNLKKYDK
jgi:hypothetical protein